MKRIILICLLAFTSISLLSQNTNDTLPTSNGYFIAVKGKYKTKSEILAKGDKVAVMLSDNRFVRGKIMETTPDYLTIDSGERIEINNIKWIRNVKPSTQNLVVGIVLASAGIVLLVPVLAGTVDLDAIVPQGGGGIGLIIAGIAIMSPTKYKLHKGDKLIYKD
jgi:hypothetical protein